jgi:hypothetical protein
MIPNTTEEAYFMVLAIVGIGLVIKAMEVIFLIKSFDKGKMFDWEIVGRDSMISGKRADFFGRLYSSRGVLVISMIIILSAVVMAVSFSNILVFKGALAFFVLSNVLMYYRQGFGLDGADQMSLLILLTCLICFLIPENQELRTIGLWFIVSQLMLSYFVSGFAKLISKQWRSGIAIQGILSTYTYGTSFTRSFFTGNLTVSRIVCWATIIFETCFPMIFLFGEYGLYIGVILGVIFHLSIALVMGLNDFVWGFSACYPALLYLAGHSWPLF